MSEKQVRGAIGTGALENITILASQDLGVCIPQHRVGLRIQTLGSEHDPSILTIFWKMWGPKICTHFQDSLGSLYIIPASNLILLLKYIYKY